MLRSSASTERALCRTALNRRAGRSEPHVACAPAHSAHSSRTARCRTVRLAHSARHCSSRRARRTEASQASHCAGQPCDGSLALKSSLPAPTWGPARTLQHRSGGPFLCRLGGQLVAIASLAAQLARSRSMAINASQTHAHLDARTDRRACNWARRAEHALAAPAPLGPRRARKEQSSRRTGEAAQWPSSGVYGRSLQWARRA